MSEQHKRKKQPEINRQLILDAAADIGAKTHWHAVTFQAIADSIGLSKGGIIHHFRNKDELLEELMRQSLSELTEWINHEMQLTGSDNASLAYLKFVINKGSDEKYQRTSKVIMQAIVAGQFHVMWDDWFQKNIVARTGPNPDESTLIIQLVADALWYADGIGFSRLNTQDKQRLLEKLK